MARFKKGTLDHDNDGRKGGSMKGKTMAKKKKDPADQAFYDQGRKARARSIARDQAPVLSDAQRKEWFEGWDFEDEQRQ